MDPPEANETTKTGHISFAQPVSSVTTTPSLTTSTPTVATLTGNHHHHHNVVGQALNGDRLPLRAKLASSGSRPSSLAAQKESSQYQLVFGIEDTSSETSLTDSPLNDRAASHHFSSPPGPGPGQEQSVTSAQGDRGGDGGGGEEDHRNPAGARVESSTGDSVEIPRESVESPLCVSDGTETDLADEAAIDTNVQSADDSKVTGTGSTSESPPSEGPSTSDAVPYTTASEISASGPKFHSQSPDPEQSDQLSSRRSRSTSLEEVGQGQQQQQQKTHPLSFLTSDSELGETPTPPPAPPYSPVPNTSGDEESEPYPAHSTSSPFTPPLTPVDEEKPVASLLFSGITYLGSSSVDAPISEVEANRKMHVLREQSEGTEPIPIILSVPLTNYGSVVLKDPGTDQPMATHPIKLILFCARGNAEVLLDCFCLNVKNRRSGLYQCHVFRCDSADSCDKVFKAIGKAFTTKAVDKSLPPLTGDSISRDFLVALDIHEEDGKGYFSPVPMDNKDCSFKLRQNTRKKVTISVSQPRLGSEQRAIVITRCFGLLISAGRDVKPTVMNLLDNMNPSPSPGPSFSVSGIWDPGLPFLASLNEESRSKYLTVAADLILESVTEPVRFKREVKVQVSKGGMSYTILNQLHMTKKKQGPMDQLMYTLKLKKSKDSSQQQSMYVVDDLRPASPAEVSRGSEDNTLHNPSPMQRLKKTGSLRGASGGGKEGALSRVKSHEDHTESDNGEEKSEEKEEDDDEIVVSGWGDVEGMREDLLKDWGDILERWVGKEKTRPTKVVKLCRKGIPRHLRCQVWQMLTGAAHDPQLAEAYRLLLSKESPAENVINWDIKRTYVGHGYFQEPANKEALYKISKAYSVYDEEVGYCQGFSFMAAVLLLQKMPEETAFSVLVKIMYNYGHRNLFKANFRDLHMMFYQLDRLLEELIPDLYQHLQANRIETHMFASQWFLTLYTAKFPLSIVFRILDIYLCEKISVIFQVALSLLKIARKDLLALDFEGILNYFRVSLPKKFQSEDDCQLLFDTMFSFKVTEKKLTKLQKDYQSYLEQQAQLEDPVMRLERDNKALRDTIHRLEQENDNLAQDLVGSKIKLRGDMDKLEEKIDSLSKEARSHKTSHEAAQLTVNELREELKQAKEEFHSVMFKLTEERQQHDGAIAEYKQVFKKLDESHQKQKEELNEELLEVKAKLGSGGTSVETADSTSSLSSEQRLRALELELAQTKLALVESQCKNQELEHKIAELSSAKTKKWYDTLDFGGKKK